MASKRQEKDDPNSAFNKAHPDEPIFVLRAQDMRASHAVRFWAFLAANNGSPRPKVEEALAQAERMDQWLAKKVAD